MLLLQGAHGYWLPWNREGQIHLAIPPPASGTAEDAAGISASYTPWDSRTLGPPHCLQLLWQDVSPALQVRSRECSGSSTSPSRSQLFQGDRKPGEGTSLNSQLQLGCSQPQFKIAPAPWIPAQNSHLVTVPVSARVVPAMFSRGLQGLCPPLHTGLVALVSPVPAPSPGPLRASASFQGPSNKGFLGKLQKYCSDKAQSVQHHLPTPCRAVVLRGAQKVTLTFLIQLYHHGVLTLLCLPFYGKGWGFTRTWPVKNKAAGGK